MDEMEKLEEMEELDELEELTEDAEMDDFAASLDPETLAAMEAALDAAEAEHNRVKTDDELLARYIEDVTLSEELAPLSEMLANPPEGVTPERVKEILAAPEASAFFAAIRMVQSEKDTYYYDSQNMTDHFAHVQMTLQDKDIMAAIASAVRHDCQLYPRPVPVSALVDMPYCYTPEEVESALAKMKHLEAYQDIDTVTASNGKVDIYSSKYMSKKYARALCEEAEVEWIEHL